MLQFCQRYALFNVSFRISDELKSRLEESARLTQKGKNWIINRAIEEYLERHSQKALVEEARRQSLEASKRPWKNETFWEASSAEVWDE